MIDNKNLRQNLEDVKNNLVLKGYNLDIDTFNQLEKQRKSLQIEVESLQAKRNDLSSQFGKAKANGDDVSNLSEEISNVNSKLKDNEDQLKPILNSIQNFLLEIPNIPDISTPAGNSEEDNVVIKTWGKIDKLIGSDHLEITKDIDSDSFLAFGNPFKEVIQFTKEKQYDLIVISTHGLTGLSHIIFGSTTEKIVRKSPVPVLTVRHPEHNFEMP